MEPRRRKHWGWGYEDQQPSADALRSGVSETLLGQKTAKQALDAVAADWQRSLRRAGIGHG